MINRHFAKLACAVAAICAILYISHKSIGQLEKGVDEEQPKQVVDDEGRPLDLAMLEMDDPRLISYIRRNYMDWPSSEPYKLTNPSAEHYSQYGQSEFISSKLFPNKSRVGTFFEAGAYDGEFLSNSLYFEKTLKWRGIIVEPVPNSVRLIRAKHRKAVLFSCCLSGHGAMLASFDCVQWDAMCLINQTEDSPQPNKRKRRPLVWCFPLYSVLLAARMTSIDYMSLDLEYFELTVLSAVPFDKLRIKVIQVEFNILDGGKKLNNTATAEKLSQLRRFFKTNWPMYREYAVMYIDVVFVNTALLDTPLPIRLRGTNDE